MPARGAGTSSAVEERASADTATRGAPPKKVIRLGIASWSAFRKGAGCRDGEGTPPRSADRSRASIDGRGLVRVSATGLFVAHRGRNGVPIEQFAIIDSTLREGEQFSNAHFTT